jgi:hypothetical protein
VSGDDISLDQSHILDEQAHDTLAVTRLHGGIVPYPREILDQRQQLLPSVCVDEAPLCLRLLLVRFLCGKMRLQLAIPLCLEIVDDESVVRVCFHIAASGQLCLVAGALQLSTT